MALATASTPMAVKQTGLFSRTCTHVCIDIQLHWARHGQAKMKQENGKDCFCKSVILTFPRSLLETASTNHCISACIAIVLVISCTEKSCRCISAAPLRSMLSIMSLMTNIHNPHGTSPKTRRTKQSGGYINMAFTTNWKMQATPNSEKFYPSSQSTSHSCWIASAPHGQVSNVLYPRTCPN